MLINQRRQARRADERAKVALQLSTVSEREITKAIQMLAEIQEALGIRRHDPELSAMQQPMSVRRVAESIIEAEEHLDMET